MNQITVAAEIKVPDTSIRDSNGFGILGPAPEPPDGADFWPVYERDGLPCDPLVAASELARGEAVYDTVNLDADTDRVAVFKHESRAEDGWNYDLPLTIAAKIEMRRLQTEFASVESVFTKLGEFVDTVDLARVFRVDAETIEAWAGQKFGAAVNEFADDERPGRRLVQRWSVERCLIGNTEFVDPLAWKPAWARCN